MEWIDDKDRVTFILGNWRRKRVQPNEAEGNLCHCQNSLCESGLGLSCGVMLVSDLTDAQDAAVALGAIRGFGKADLGRPATWRLVARVAGSKIGGER
jgi:hypothetical protein